MFMIAIIISSIKNYHSCATHLLGPSDSLTRAGNVTSSGLHKYTCDLMELEATATREGPHNFRPATPLRIQAWQEALAGHPDKQYVQYLLTGINEGFHIGAKRQSASLKSAHHNMPTVEQHSELITAHIQEEVQAGRVLGPLPQHLSKLCHISPLGLIPKPHQPGRWRLIVDLSSPSGHSVNDLISPDICHMHYASVLDAAALIRQLGQGTLLAKIDLQHAYRVVPVHADDHPLLGIQWQSDTYIDTALPFGLRSAPKIFSAVADGLAWILGSRGISGQLHYLDDFLFLGPPDSPACATFLRQAIETCKELGVPVAHHKSEGPATCLTFLGIQIDTVSMQLSLPRSKLSRIIAATLSWRGKKAATKRDLQSLIGLLSHAATVVPPGRTFLRRMIDTMKLAKRPNHWVRLNAEFQSDLQWWASFLPLWNGRSIMPLPEAAHSFAADASGSWGCGAVSKEGRWFQVKWPQHWLPYNIAAKEMVPVVLAIALWGPTWASKTVRVESDNMAVVCALSSGAAKDPLLMHLLRCLHFFSASYQIVLTAEHLPGILNTAADALSRNNLSNFFICSPQACKLPSPIPQSLTDMLILQRPDWTCPSWRRMFLSTLGRH